jgi:putative copper export protein
VLAATVWVGGQLTLAGLVPSLRALTPDAPRVAARQFNRIAWPAFGVVVITGIWNMLARDTNGDIGYQVLLGFKILVVALSGIAAFLHSVAKTRTALAVWGAVSGLSALAALVMGVVLHG